jgi:hypothetical protein
MHAAWLINPLASLGFAYILIPYMFRHICVVVEKEYHEKKHKKNRKLSALLASQACWIYLPGYIKWDFALQPELMFLKARELFGSYICREVLIIACWSIWCHRNNIIIFDACSLSFLRWMDFFQKGTVTGNPFEGSQSLTLLINNWLSSL